MTHSPFLSPCAREHGYIRLDAVPYHIGDLQHSLIRIINTNHSSLTIAICKGHYFFSDIFQNNCFQFNILSFLTVHNNTPGMTLVNIQLLSNHMLTLLTILAR